jgi:hypothetical protein
MIDIILSALENGEGVHTSARFSIKYGLIHKLGMSFGICGYLLEMFKSYLSNRTCRKQCVVLNGMSSTLKKISAGVPQGSLLGPILFIMFINDLSQSVISDLLLFADDSTLLCLCRPRGVSIPTKLSAELVAIEIRAKMWLVTFNPDKTEAMIFSAKRVASPANNLFFLEKHINAVSIHRHFGYSSQSKIELVRII